MNFCRFLFGTLIVPATLSQPKSNRPERRTLPLIPAQPVTVALTVLPRFLLASRTVAGGQDLPMTILGAWMVNASVRGPTLATTNGASTIRKWPPEQGGGGTRREKARPANTQVPSAAATPAAAHRRTRTGANPLKGFIVCRIDELGSRSRW